MFLGTVSLHACVGVGVCLRTVPQVLSTFYVLLGTVLGDGDAAANESL